MSFRPGYLYTSITLRAERKGEQLGKMARNRKRELQGEYVKRMKGHFCEQRALFVLFFDLELINRRCHES